jgi:hypothetical protein
VVVNPASPPDSPPSTSPLRLVDSGRLTVQADVWRKPLPEVLWRRLAEQRRREHERLVARYVELGVEVATLAGALERQKSDDEAALRAAVAKGRKPPTGKTPALEQELEERRRAAEAAGRMVVESGSALVGSLGEDDLAGAITDAQAEARQILEGLPPVADGIRAELLHAGELAGQAQWVAVLQQRRRHAPFRSSPSFGSSRLSSAAEAAARLDEMLRAELSELDFREAPPVQHRPPGGFPIPEGHRFTSSGIAAPPPSGEL